MFNINTNLSKSKVSKAKLKAVLNLKNNPGIVICKANKRGQIIITVKSDYLTKTQQ